jgi:hypothetical protein
MSAFIERITGGQVGGTTERSNRLRLSKKNAPKYPQIRERQLGALLGVED